MTQRGRRSKYTPERVEKIVQALSIGATRKLAGQYADIDDNTFCAWLNRYEEFREAVTRAESSGAMKWLALIDKAAQMDWKAAAWKLERLHHEGYARVDRLDVTLRQAAEKAAAELGMEAKDVLAEAERLVRGG